jgi:hypothetical protein
MTPEELIIGTVKILVHLLFICGMVEIIFRAVQTFVLPYFARSPQQQVKEPNKVEQNVPNRTVLVLDDLSYVLLIVNTGTSEQAGGAR